MVEALRNKLEVYWAELILLIPDLLLALFILALSIFIGRKLSTFLRKKFFGRAENPLLDKFISQMIRAVIIVVGLSLALKILGLGGIAGSMMAGAGVSALILGFAFKDIGENFLAGIILAFSRPFAVGDTIEVEKSLGKIESLSIRHTQVKTFDGKDVYIPNSMIIKNPLVNHTRDGFIRYDFTIGIAFEDDVSAARALILEELHKIEGILKDKKPVVAIAELASSTVNLKIYFWVDTFNTTISVFDINSNAMNSVKLVLQKNGFSMPSDIVEMKIYQEKQPIPLRIVTDEKSADLKA
ncbi:MAG: mechanosensitive ion channel family protein [Bacteroidia bacterium]